MAIPTQRIYSFKRNDCIGKLIGEADIFGETNAS